MPASRWSASRTWSCFCSSCASYARSWKRQPPQAGKWAHGASTRSGPGLSTSVASASAWLRLTFVTRARTRSPGSPRRTKTTKPFSRATPFPPYARESIRSSSSWSSVTGAAMQPTLAASFPAASWGQSPGRGRKSSLPCSGRRAMGEAAMTDGHGPSGQSGQIDLAVARAVELAEEDALVGAEGQVAVPERDEHLRADQRPAYVRGRVRAVLVLVAPAPAVLDDLLQCVLEVVEELGVDALVDGHARGRVRHVDERGRRAVRTVELAAHLVGDLDELGPPIGPQGNLPHGDILRRWSSRSRAMPPWPRTASAPTASSRRCWRSTTSTSPGSRTSSTSSRSTSATRT